MWGEKMLKAYLRHCRKTILIILLISVIFTVMMLLYSTPPEPVIYGCVLCFFMGLAVFAVSFLSFCRKRKLLIRQKNCPEETVYTLPETSDPIELAYQELIDGLCRDRAEISDSIAAQRNDMLDYYTLWAHQIKTPMAAMDLLLQAPEPDAAALSAELFKAEQYVEMVLSYVRLGSETTDYSFARRSLDVIVRQSIRKYAKLFILKKISLTFEDSGRTVITDEKWLSFIIEQLISNALKYTPSGGRVRIYSRGDTLIIADSGIGIRAEDLPRVFEKGFTGYNGREHKKSTGIGLYLCREISGKIGCRVSISSSPGEGTEAMVSIPEKELTSE